MAKVTSKLQVTLPKALAVRYGIGPGDNLRFEEAGEVIRVVPPGNDDQREPLDVEVRLRIFDAATARLQAQAARPRADVSTERGWTREDLYRRGGADAD